LSLHQKSSGVGYSIAAGISRCAQFAPCRAAWWSLHIVAIFCGGREPPV